MKKFRLPIVGLFLAFQASAALSAPNWSIYYNISYGNGTVPQQTADLYLLNRGVNPVVVFIHGGAWQAGDKSAYAGSFSRRGGWASARGATSIGIIARRACAACFRYDSVRPPGRPRRY
jgi:acetyl esterase/lipase